MKREVSKASQSERREMWWHGDVSNSKYQVHLTLLALGAGFLTLLALGASLANSDEEANPTNNANGDLRSNSAAGSGDPRRAQDELRTLRKPALLLPDHWIVQTVGFDHEGQELVTAATQSFVTIRRWDVVSKKLISEIKLEGDQHGRPFREGTLLLSGDRRRVLAATDAYVGFWETAIGKLLTKLPIPKIENADTVRLLTCTPDFSVIVGSLTLPPNASF